MKHPPKRLVSCELISLAANQPQAFVQQCELAYRRRVASLARRILSSGCHIVMLTGPSATGKTTSANKLAQAVTELGRPARVLSLDDFFLGEGRYPKHEDGTDDYECLEALDLPVLRDCLRRLYETGVSEAPVFDFVTEQPCGTQLVDCRDGIVVVEGLHALNPAITDHLPAQAVFNVYASIREEYADPEGLRCLKTQDLRLARRLNRDAVTRGHDAAETLDMWPHVCEGEEKYIKAFRFRADGILDTAHSYEPCLWSALLTPLLDTVPAEHPGRETLAHLCGALQRFPALPVSLVPTDSMLREFVD